MAEFKYINYKDSDVYRNAPKSLKRAIEDYISTYKPSNQMMYLQLRRYELNHLDKKQKRAVGPMFSLVITVLVIVSYFSMREQINGTSDLRILIPLLSILITMCIVYYAGWLSDANLELRQIRKELKKYPEIPEFTGTDNA